MDILVLCHFGMYQNLDISFIHQQAKAYVELGHRVKALVPVAIGKKDWFGRRWSAAAFEADGVEIIPVRHLSLSNYGKKVFNTKSAIAALRGSLRAVLKDFHPAVIHAHTLGFDSEVGAWLKTRLNCPLVVTTHGDDTTELYTRGEAETLKRFCSQLDMVVGVSTKLVAELNACGVTGEKACVLNGFSIRNVPEERDKQPLSFLQVGNLLAPKKVDVTIRAFAKVHALHPEAVLTVIGRGPEKAGLEALCKDLNIADSVRFLGQRPNAEVLSEMAKTQFFVMPSHPEGFGIVYLEAMANGCVTIGTQGEGIADLIVSGENGFLVPPDDSQAIVRVVENCLRDPETMRTVAERGRKDARELTWEKNAQAYTKLFEELSRGAT